MPKPVIITCAPTGGIHTPTMSPHLPVTPDDIATASIEAVEAGAAIVHLHLRILGRFDAPGSADVDRTFKLFAGIVNDAKKQKSFEKREAYACRQGGALADDPHYTIRAWRAVVTYLLRRPEFLYE